MLLKDWNGEDVNQIGALGGESPQEPGSLVGEE